MIMIQIMNFKIVIPHITFNLINYIEFSDCLHFILMFKMCEINTEFFIRKIKIVTVYLHITHNENNVFIFFKSLIYKL